MSVQILFSLFSQHVFPKMSNWALRSFFFGGGALIKYYQIAVQEASFFNAMSLFLHNIFLKCIFDTCKWLTIFFFF